MSIEDMNHPPKVTGPTNGHSEDMMLTRTPSSINSKRHLLMPSAGARLKQIVVVSLLLVGFIVCVTSLVAILLLPSFVSNQISKRLVLKNNSMLLERWSKPNVPMYFKVWVYDIQNAHELALKRDTKPQVKEVGPFVFHLKRQKDIVSFAGDNLYYTERKVYHFSPELSCCAINTTVTIPNIPLVAVVDRALSYNLPLVGRFIPRLINRAIQSLREPLFVRKQVREILFDGYEVELLKMVSRVGAIVGLPQTNEKFALLKGRNDTWRPEQDGVWAINTGASDRKQFGKVSSWNSYKQLPFWASSGCNAINGSDGTLFPPPIKSTEPLYIFNQELCRTVNLVYERPSEVRGIKSLRFALNPMNFAHTMTGNGGPVGVASSSLSSNQLRLRKPTTTTGGLTETAPKVTGSTKPSLLPAILPQGTGTALSGNDILKTSAATQKQQQVVPMVYHKSNLLPANIDDASSLQANGKRWRFSGASQPSSAQMTTNGMGPPATRAEQERFVLAAQEAQAQAERLPNQRNPFTCFCDRKSTNLNGVNVCEFDGLIDLSKCTKQAQVIFGSMPHFYRGDPRLARQVVGMQPNASRHTTYLDIEPVSFILVVMAVVLYEHGDSNNRV